MAFWNEPLFEVAGWFSPPNNAFENDRARSRRGVQRERYVIKRNLNGIKEIEEG